MYRRWVHLNFSPLLPPIFTKVVGFSDAGSDILFLTEDPLPDPTPDPTQQSETDPTDPNGAKRTRNGPKWTEIKLSGVARLG